eukprot:gene17458-biopygen8333
MPRKTRTKQICTCQVARRTRARPLGTPLLMDHPGNAVLCHLPSAVSLGLGGWAREACTRQVALCSGVPGRADRTRAARGQCRFSLTDWSTESLMG